MTGSIIQRPRPESRQDRRQVVLSTLGRRHAQVRQRRAATLRTAGLLRSVVDYAAERHPLE